MEISQGVGCGWPDQMGAIQMEANGWTEVIVTDESKDVIVCKGLCHIY